MLIFQIVFPNKSFTNDAHKESDNLHSEASGLLTIGMTERCKGHETQILLIHLKIACAVRSSGT